jgi:plasmid stability protein
MANITIRNIPDSIFQKIKLMSEIDKRSLNNELLIVLEKGVRKMEDENKEYGIPLNKDIQISIWKELSGEWEDKRDTEEIIKEIYETRSLGREVEL